MHRWFSIPIFLSCMVLTLCHYSGFLKKACHHLQQWSAQKGLHHHPHVMLAAVRGHLMLSAVRGHLVKDLMERLVMVTSCCWSTELISATPQRTSGQQLHSLSVCSSCSHLWMRWWRERSRTLWLGVIASWVSTNKPRREQSSWWDGDQCH